MQKKLVGTLAPLSALKSAKLGETGTFAVGRQFLKWLKSSHQHAWQLLPLHQTQLEPNSASVHVPSPYKSYGIGLCESYLSKEYLDLEPDLEELSQFENENSDWLQDYAFFCALRDYFQTDDWSLWEKGVRDRDNDALRNMERKLAREIRNHIVIQYRLHKDYSALRKQAKDRDISLLGDFPFYIGYSSPLVWANQELFELDENKKMTFVSGLPDGPKAHFGRQVWNHPLYRWEEKDKGIMELWKLRMRYSSSLYDYVRLDHAKGFFNYGAMSINNQQEDQLKKGLGKKALVELLDYSQELGIQVFAEDSGDKLGELRNTLKEYDIPGIRVLRYAMAGKGGKEIDLTYADVSSYKSNTVAYTSTHDTETLLGFLEILTQKQKQLLSTSAGVEYSDSDKILATNLRTAVINSPANVVIIPIQDWLLTKDRINIPGTEKEVGDTNWRYQLNTPVEYLPPPQLN